MSFTTLRDSAAFPPGPAAQAFFLDRLLEFAAAARTLGKKGAARLQEAEAIFTALARRAQEYFAPVATSLATASATIAKSGATAVVNAGEADVASDTPVPSAGVETAASPDIEIRFEARRCIHSRFCVTGAPAVFLANVKGPWIHPEAMPVDRLVEVAHACPSGAIRYARRDGQPDEAPPPVNLASVREAGPYAFRGELRLAGDDPGYRVTLCRCGASRHKPYCDGSHHDVGFAATGEPPTGKTDMLDARNGVLSIDPEPDGPLRVSGNLEITSGTGRVVARVEAARLCRCGGSQNKPFCDGTHAKIGFRS
ncbi:MAG: CDGSH iron-sulfur domain-containing protein [Gammaproteobacteria bacterium]|nr:CDGSH iron-sulfur domain-containing protein [Gammaproteobacteria bacterium]